VFEPPLPSSDQPPAGRYPDPERPGGQLRWWDGARWAPPNLSATGASRRGHLPDIGEWLGTAFRRAIVHWRALAVISIVTTVPSTVLISLALRRATDGVVIHHDRVEGWSADRLPAVVVMATVAALLVVVASLAVARLMLRIIDDADATSVRRTGRPEHRATGGTGELVASSLTTALTALPRALGWMLVLMLGVGAVIVVLGLLLVAVAPLGILLVLAALPIGLLVGGRLAFVGIAVADRSGNPFARSSRISDGRSWAVLGRLLLIGVIAWGISAITNTAVNLLSGSAIAGFDGIDPIELDADGGLSSLDVSSLSPSAWGVLLAAGAALATGILVAGATTAALTDLYRTRNPRR
jgi:hypothetical protein